MKKRLYKKSSKGCKKYFLSTNCLTSIFQKLTETLQNKTHRVKTFEKTVKKSSNNSFSPKKIEQATSPHKKRRFSQVSFEIYHNEPTPIGLASTFFKENVAQINQEIEPLQREFDRLKKFQEDLKGEIMVAKLSERENSLKTEFLLTNKIVFKEENEKEKHENIHKNQTFETKINKVIQEDGNLMDTLRKMKKGKDFQENLKPIIENNFNKENIDRLSNEIEELLSLQKRRIASPRWHELSEIKEAEIEDSFL